MEKFYEPALGLEFKHPKDWEVFVEVESAYISLTNWDGDVIGHGGVPRGGITINIHLAFDKEPHLGDPYEVGVEDYPGTIYTYDPLETIADGHYVSFTYVAHGHKWIIDGYFAEPADADSPNAEAFFELVDSIRHDPKTDLPTVPPWEAAVDYHSVMEADIFRGSSAIEDIESLLGIPAYEEEWWQYALSRQLDTLRDIIYNASTLDPPPGYAPFHNEWLIATDYFELAANELEQIFYTSGFEKSQHALQGYFDLHEARKAARSAFENHWPDY